LENIRF